MRFDSSGIRTYSWKVVVREESVSSEDPEEIICEFRSEKVSQYFQASP